MQEAKYFTRQTGNRVICTLCPHGCLLADGEEGLCRGRVNRRGTLYATNYGQTISVNLDPIEKKPLYHFLPGNQILSIASNSCNFRCDFCQNFSISQQPQPTFAITPEMLLELCTKHHCSMVAFTYTEPLTWYEFVLDAAGFLQKHHIKTVLVTNGFINPEPLAELLPVIDAMNIDLKAMYDGFYKKICGGALKPVLATIRYAAKHCHLELTNLLIPGENDSDSQIESLIDFVASVDRRIPLHFSKYFPHYLRSTQPTDEKTLYHALEMARAELDFVYLGNIIHSHTTRCPQCGELLITRGTKTTINLQDGSCPSCNYPVYGVWK